MSAENEIRNIKLFEEEIRNIKQMAFDAAHPVNETYTQYPQQDDPMTLYNKDGVTSVWEIQAQYSGAFFRSSNAPLTVYKADDEEQYYTLDSVTGALVPTNVTANGGPSVSPTPSGAPIVIEGKTYNQYAVTASSRNAADYIIKTNLLNVQNQATALNGIHGNKQTVTSGDMSTNSYKTWANGGREGHGLSGVSDTGVRYNEKIRGDAYINEVMQVQAWWNHTHSSTFTPSISSNDSETRPDNFTSIIWKRII